MNAAQNEIIQTFIALAETLEREQSMLENALLGQGYIVMCEVVPLSFSIENNVAHTPRHCGTPGQATRFTKRDAEVMAEQVTNGKGTKAVAVHVRAAIDQALSRTRELLVTLQTTQH